MRKLYLLFLLTFFVTSLVFSQNTETITIATYYPSPSGVYRNLRFFPTPAEPASNCNGNTEGMVYYDNNTNQLQLCRHTQTLPDAFLWQGVSLWTLDGVSPNQRLYPNDTTWNVGIRTSNPQGPLEVNDSIVLTPRAGDPNAWPAGAEGQFAYSNTNDGFYYYNGNAWVAQGGGGGYFLQCGGSCPTGTTYVGCALYGTAIGGVIADRGYNGYSYTQVGSSSVYTCSCFSSEQVKVGSVSTACTATTQCGTSTGESGGGSPLPQHVSGSGCAQWCAGRPACSAGGSCNNISICK